MSLHQILELDQMAKTAGKQYPKRRLPHYNQVIHALGKHFTGIVGPRGAGKTILLKQLTSQLANAFYLSVDTLTEETLFDIAKHLQERYKIEHLLLDEVHFQRNFEGELKKIFDFLNVKVVFTSSAALAMIDSAYDLSRRVQLISLYPFSFREFLFFTKNVQLPLLTMDQLIQKHWTPEHLQFGYAFEAYLKGGLYPFALEELDPLPLLKNILQKIIQKDIPKIAQLKTEEVERIEKTVAFIGRSPADDINYTTLSKNLGITKYKAEQYLTLLQKSFVLQTIFPKGTNVLREPKVLLSLPYRLLYKPYEEAIGALREDFFAETMAMAKLPFHYLKSKQGKKTPDFLVNTRKGKMIVEVGGKGKGKTQFKGVHIKDKIRFLHGDQIDEDRRPLFLLGYLT